MTPEEQVRFQRMEEQLKEVHRAFTGDTMTRIKGFFERLTTIEEKLLSMELQMKKIKSIATGIAIGVLIGGLMFGLVSWDSFIKWIKELK